MCNPRTSYFHDDIIKLKINPLEFIEQICFDPRADDAYVLRCKKSTDKSFFVFFLANCEIYIVRFLSLHT